MNLDLIVTTPLAFSLTLPEKPTNKQQAIHDVIQGLGAEWVSAGQSSTRKLWCVITRTNDLSVLRAAITKYKLPITILAAQNAQKTAKVVDDVPVLDADDNPVMEVVVHDPTTKKTLLKYMPDEVTTDIDTGKELSRKKATTVSLPVWGGHEQWQV